MNLFFDLMKIECRSLTDELRKHYNPSKALIDEVYDRHIELFSNRSQLFLHEVNRGRNTRRMKHWNKHIEEALGVDNMALYPSEVEQD
jgi:hypothetical protein